MIYIETALAGAFFSLYRGGIFGKRKDKLIEAIRPRGLSQFVDIVLDGKVINAAAFGFFAWSMGHGAAAAVFAGIMMLRGSAPGWGDYIGAIGGWRKGAHFLPSGMILSNPDAPEYQLYKPLQEVDYIDRMIERLQRRPVVWGMAGLSLRCAEWGLFLGAPLLCFWTILAGAVAGPAVYALSRILPHAYVWRGFEALIGALFWSAAAIP